MEVNDVVVVVPGITGSTLRDAHGHEVWGVGAGTIVRAIRSFGRSISTLRLPPDHGDGPAPDGVTPGVVMPDFHVIPGIWTPVTGYSALLSFLRNRTGLLDARPGSLDAPPGNLLTFPYDWRLSNRHNAELLGNQAELVLERWRASAPERAEARLVFICHSMGGLVARWYLHQLGGAVHTRLLITLGTPYRGAMNALDQLVNGMKKGFGPFGVDLTAFVRSLPAAHQLLPEYACLDAGDGALKNTTEAALPGLDPHMVADGRAFHDAINQAASEGEAGFEIVPFVGTRQPTFTTGRVEGQRVAAAILLDGEDHGGDGTVPRLSAKPKEMHANSVVVRGLAEGHGHLQENGAVLDQIDALLTADDREPRAVPVLGPSVHVPDLVVAGDEIVVEAELAEEPNRLLQATLLDERNREVGRALVRDGRVSFPTQMEGGFTVVVAAPDDPGGVAVPPVRQATLVWDAGP